MININEFTQQFTELTDDWNWEIEGFVDSNQYVYPIDSDTKVISTVFERLSSPVIRSISKKHKYIVELANQTTYPDFTLSTFDRDGNLIHRIAIDIKTTYLQKSLLFTLGGFNSFLRTETKNILYPYSTYNEHWIIGFIYRRNEPFEEYDLDKMPKSGDIPCPYGDVTMFVREKHSISGLRAGSGNTKNIGSIKLKDPKMFATANGPFTKLNNPKEGCDKFWRNYENYIPEISNEEELLCHPDFIDM